MKEDKFNNYKLIIAIILFFGFISMVFLFSSGFGIKANKVVVVNANAINQNNINKCSYVQQTSSDEVVEKRGYDSQTFRNPDGSYRAEIAAGNEFFYDGVCYVDLNKISEPLIDKKEINLTVYPEDGKNIFDFGTYTLSKGIIPVLNNQNQEFNLLDANNQTIKTLPRPFSVDSSGIVSLGDYLVDFNNNSRELKLGVEVNNSWLQQAKYPVVVDPTVYLTNVSRVYDGHAGMNSGGCFRNVGPAGIFVGGGSTFGPDRGFAQFNLSSIPLTATITSVAINLTTSIATMENISITRFSNTSILDTSKYPNNNAGDCQLLTDIAAGIPSANGQYVINFTGFQSLNPLNAELNLGNGSGSPEANASIDIMDHLKQGRQYLAVGLRGNYEPAALDATVFNSSEGGGVTSGLKLIVKYSGDGCGQGTCTYFGLGDWLVNQTCNPVSTKVDGDLYVCDSGVFNMSAININFTSSNQHIYVYSGGQIIVNNNTQFSTGFNK